MSLACPGLCWVFVVLSFHGPFVAFREQLGNLREPNPSIRQDRILPRRLGSDPRILGVGSARRTPSQDRKTAYDATTPQYSDTLLLGPKQAYQLLGRSIDSF